MTDSAAAVKRYQPVFVLSRPGHRSALQRRPGMVDTEVMVELVLNADHFTKIVKEGIAQAQVSIDLMTADFKAMLIPTGRGRAKSIVDLFRQKAAAGVEIRLLHAGVPSSAALLELREALPHQLTIRRCPRLHSKAVIIDAATLYLGSANLTGAGLGAKSPTRRNFEMGIWTRSPDLIDPVLGEFNTLWEGLPCKTCGRRDVCPQPLEEPQLTRLTTSRRRTLQRL